MQKFNTILTYLTLLACFISVVIYYKNQKLKKIKYIRVKGKRVKRANLEKPNAAPDWFARHEKVIVIVLFIIGVAVRVYQFVHVPGGLNQDEASSGYDAFATAFYGIDRNGFHFPSYSVAWGSGQSVLILYLTAIVVRFLGLSVFSIRLVSLIFGISSLIIFYLLVKKLSGIKAGIIALLLLAISPWHIMISRWALDCNLLPGAFLLAIYLLVVAIDKKSTKFYCLAAAALSVSMYAYATVCIIMPLFL